MGDARVNDDHDARTGTSRSTLLGYAVLRANFDHSAPSYLDNFNAFVLDALAERYPAAADEAEVGEAIRTTFGLTIPDRVVGRLLRKLAKGGRAQAEEERRYSLTETARSGLQSLRESMSNFQSRQYELLGKFTSFVKEFHDESAGLIDADPGAHLQAFIERYAAPLLRRGVAGQRDNASPWGELQGAEYLVGAFVLHLEANDAATFSYLIDAVKGAILLSVLEIGPGDLSQKLSNLTLVFDTPVLLSALGYQGEMPQRAARQLLQLACELGVRLTYFEHTGKELSGVLDAAIVALRNPARSAEALRAVGTHFLDVGATASDVAIEQTMLHANLQRLGLRSIDKPESYFRYGLDESALEDLFKSKLPTQRESTRLYDLESISAIHRLRRGNSPNSFERCGYVLVTDNYGLTVVARQVDERHLWPLAMLDSEVASLLWVRSPAIADDLPRQQLLAAVYTGMQPAPHLWMKYVEEIERLQARGGVEPDEAIMLRSQPEARSALMDVTLGDTSKINPESVQVIVDRVRANLSSPYRVEADDARAQRDHAAREAESARQAQEELRKNVSGLRAELDELQSQVLARDQLIEQRATRRAYRIRLAVVITIATTLVLPVTLQAIIPSEFKHVPTAITLIVASAAVILLVIGILGSFIPGTFWDWLGPLERHMAKRIERRLRTSAALPPRAGR
ncbi:MAG TPA: hypothetical protein VNF47_13170 [Streptosporangiaceae bacterium]|nr:hypothetical protein [Streptosporangiaceae bacterium]